ncbi:hypothetical protein WDU94_005832 [Cyamophila willieti]
MDLRFSFILLLSSVYVFYAQIYLPRKDNIIVVYGYEIDKDNEHIMRKVQDIGFKLNITNPLSEVVKAYRSRVPAYEEPIVIHMINKKAKEHWLNIYEKRQFDIYFKERWQLMDGLQKGTDVLMEETESWAKKRGYIKVWLKNDTVVYKKNETSAIYAVPDIEHLHYLYMNEYQAQKIETPAEFAEYVIRPEGMELTTTRMALYFLTLLLVCGVGTSNTFHSENSEGTNSSHLKTSHAQNSTSFQNENSHSSQSFHGPTSSRNSQSKPNHGTTHRHFKPVEDTDGTLKTLHGTLKGKLKKTFDSDTNDKDNVTFNDRNTNEDGNHRHHKDPYNGLKKDQDTHKKAYDANKKSIPKARTTTLKAQKFKITRKRHVISVYGIPQEPNENLMKILEEVGHEIALENPLKGVVKAYRSLNPKDLTIKPIVVQLFNKTLRDLWVNEFMDNDLFIENFYLIGRLPKQIHGTESVHYPGYVPPENRTTGEPELDEDEDDSDEIAYYNRTHVYYNKTHIHIQDHPRVKFYEQNKIKTMSANETKVHHHHQHNHYKDYNETYDSSYVDLPSDESTDSLENPECTYCRKQNERMKKKAEGKEVENESKSIEMFEAHE